MSSLHAAGLGIAGVIGTVAACVLAYMVLATTLWAFLRRKARRVHIRPGPGPLPDVRASLHAATGRTQAWGEIPPSLFRDWPWTAALVLLGRPSLRDRAGEFVDFSTHRIDWAGLLAASTGWPTDQRQTVLMAYILVLDPGPDRPRRS